jgi:hypothetical protein
MLKDHYVHEIDDFTLSNVPAVEEPTERIEAHVKHAGPIDMQDLAYQLQARVGMLVPERYVLGKTRLRDAVIGILGCSALKAEWIVDMMEAHGFLHFCGDPKSIEGHPGHWEVEPYAAFWEAFPHLP